MVDVSVGFGNSKQTTCQSNDKKLYSLGPNLYNYVLLDNRVIFLISILFLKNITITLLL